MAGLLGAFLWQNAAGSAVRTLEDIGCSTKLFWQQCDIDPSQQLNPSISPCHTAIHSLTSSSLERLCQPYCVYSRAASSLSPQTASLYLTSSSHIPLSPSLSLTCSLSHASAQPSSFPLSSIALLIALIPPLLTYTISPPYHTVPTLKLSFLTSLRHHAALSPLQNSGCRTENFLTPPLSLIFAPFLF